MYIRFITGEIDEKSQRETGVFGMAYRLRDSRDVPDSYRTRFRELLKWFNANLEKPDRFTTSKPPYYRKQSKAISWFKDSAKEHIAKLRQIVALLDSYGIHMEMIQTDRPGYIVYEDAHQIVAEPFSDADF
jgi:hypothetical protein